MDLPDGIGDDDYLAWLDNALSSGLRQFEPELLCYIAGADPYREDQLGGLALTIEGLKKRDELVFRVARARNIPVMVTYAGGYARGVEDTVTIHCNTVIAAKEIFGPKSDSGVKYHYDCRDFRTPEEGSGLPPEARRLAGSLSKAWRTPGRLRQRGVEPGDCASLPNSILAK